jgi:hypothetical protein
MASAANTWENFIVFSFLVATILIAWVSCCEPGGREIQQAHYI